MKSLNINRIGLLLSALFILFGTAVPGYSEPSATIIFSGDLQGNIQPCPT